MKVNFVNHSYRRFYAKHRKEIDRAIGFCLSKGELTLRKAVWDMEKSLAKLAGVKYGVGVNSGTDALFLSVLALGIGKGDEVITVSNTFVASIQAIVNAGATPILIDVTEDELMDVSQIEAKITKRTKAIMPIHYTGKVCDMTEIMRIAKKHKLFVIEDACQSVGATHNGKPAGSFGDTGCYSFNTAKLMGGITDGGMVVTNNRKLAETIALLRNHWNVHQLSVNRNDYPQPKEMRWAWKSRLQNVNAAYLNVKMKYLPFILKRRAQVAGMYWKGLWELQDYFDIILPKFQKGEVWQEYHVRAKDREPLVAFLRKKGIETLTRDAIPNHKMKGLGLSHWNLPVTEMLAKEVFRLPLTPELTNKEVEYVIKCVRDFYRSEHTTLHKTHA